MEVRVVDMNILIEFIKSEAKKSKMFECECIGKSLQVLFIANIVHIDINNFTILGQTLGADTALQCYKSMPDVFKLYCTIDATFFWAWEDINSSKFKITKPILMLYSERYYKFKGDECFKDYDPQILNDKLFGNNKNKKSYNV